MNRIRKWTSLLALLLALTLGVPAGAEDAYLYMPWAILWHGEEYYERIESYDQTSERGSGVQYSMAFGLNPVDIGTEMDWTIQEYGCSNVADLLDAIMDPGMYLMFMSLWHRAALLGSEIYYWEFPMSGGDGYGHTTDEYYLFQLQYLEGGERMVLVNMYGQSDSGDSVEARVIESTFYREPDWSQALPMGDCIVLGSPYLKEEPDSVSVPRAVVPGGTLLEDCYMVSEDYAHCVFMGIPGYIPLEYLTGANGTEYDDGYDDGYENSYEGEFDPNLGAVEQDFGKDRLDDFWSYYPDYEPFEGRCFAGTTHTEGWCIGDYLFTADCRYYQVANCDFAWMHSEAAEASREILAVDAGEWVRVNGEYGDWMLCLYNDRYGWIPSEYLQVVTDPDEYEGEEVSPLVGQWQCISRCDETHPEQMILYSDGTGVADGKWIDWFFDGDFLFMDYFYDEGWFYGCELVDEIELHLEDSIYLRQ